MNKLKRIHWEINDVYGSVSNWVYNRFTRRCRRQAEAIYNEKFDIAMRYNYKNLSYTQEYLMWSEAMDSIINRPMNKLILKFLEAWDAK